MESSECAKDGPDIRQQSTTACDSLSPNSCQGKHDWALTGCEGDAISPTRQIVPVVSRDIRDTSGMFLDQQSLDVVLGMEKRGMLICGIATRGMRVSKRVWKK